MNAAQLHLLLNHVPILGFCFAGLLMLAGLWRRSRDLQAAALCTFVVAGVVSIAVFLSGEPAEEVVEHLPGVAEAAIGEHEEAAEVAFGLMLATGVAAGVGLAVGRVREAKWFPPALLALGAVAFVVVSWAGHLGGLIRHTEIGSGAPAAAGGHDEDAD